MSLITGAEQEATAAGTGSRHAVETPRKDTGVGISPAEERTSIARGAGESARIHKYCARCTSIIIRFILQTD